MNPAPPPAPGLTPAERAHFQSLGSLYAALNTACRDPQTSDDDIALLLPRVTTVWNEMTAMNELALSRDTFDLQADAHALDPALADLKRLKEQLEGYARHAQAVLEVLVELDQALATAQELGLTL